MSDETAAELPDLEELEVVCAQCSFPMVQELDENGEVTGFRIEPGPKTDEDALAAGWIDHGLGLYCPKCSIVYLEDLARDRAADAGTYTGGGISDLINGQVFRMFLPHVSNDTIDQFVRMFHSQRIAKLQKALGQEPVPLYVPVARDEAQAKEFLEVTDLLPTLEEKLNPKKETP